MRKRFVRLSLIIMIIMICWSYINSFSNTIGRIIGTDYVQEGNLVTITENPVFVEANTCNLRIVGSILSLIGGFGMLLSGFALYKEL